MQTPPGGSEFRRRPSPNSASRGAWGTNPACLAIQCAARGVDLCCGPLGTL
jgi:hypothetical protein